MSLGCRTCVSLTSDHYVFDSCGQSPDNLCYIPSVDEEYDCGDNITLSWFNTPDSAGLGSNYDEDISDGEFNDIFDQSFCSDPDVDDASEYGDGYLEAYFSVLEDGKYEQLTSGLCGGPGDGIDAELLYEYFQLAGRSPMGLAVPALFDSDDLAARLYSLRTTTGRAKRGFSDLTDCWTGKHEALNKRRRSEAGTRTGGIPLETPRPVTNVFPSNSFISFHLFSDVERLRRITEAQRVALDMVLPGVLTKAVGARNTRGRIGDWLNAFIWGNDNILQESEVANAILAEFRRFDITILEQAYTVRVPPRIIRDTYYLPNPTLNTRRQDASLGLAPRLAAAIDNLRSYGIKYDLRTCPSGHLLLEVPTSANSFSARYCEQAFKTAAFYLLWRGILVRA
ncbi:hypothetical protein DFH27DRAFT_615933 [Peziza echinospora]|nr:hypothetical protein DFH27DRAFT_615933 [Peziza echinospora]